MYLAIGSRMSKLKRRLQSKRRQRAKAKQLREQKRIIKRVFLAFIGITGIVLMWSGISRFALDSFSIGESFAIGVGLLFVSGLLTKRFVRMFA